MTTIAINATGLPAHPTGAARWQYSLLQAMQHATLPRDWQVQLYLPANIDHQRVLEATPQFTAVPTAVSSSSRRDRLILAPLLASFRAAQQHADLYATFQHPVLPLPRASVVTVYDVRFLLQPHTYRRSRLLFLRLMVPASLRLASQIITISHATRNDLVRLLGIDDDKISVVYPGIREQFRVLPAGPQLAGAQAYLRERRIEGPFILFVGQIEPRKNLERLVAALPLLEQRLGRSVPLLIVGGQYYFNQQSVEQAAHRAGVAERVHFTGVVDDDLLVALYTLCSVHVLPSTHEGFGLTLLEAMACGAPIVAARAGSLPEVVGNTAVLVDPYSVESIADGLAQVLGSATYAAHLRAAGGARVRSFSWQQAASQTIDIFGQVIERHRLRSRQ